MQYDGFLLVSFGGPEGPDEVLPFLENVLRGRNVPRERMLEVAEHYQHFGGVSPINAQNRELLAAIERDFAEHGVDLPVFWGNRNWRPLLPDALREMREQGVTNAIALFTSAYSSYSGCRQYRENIAAAQEQIGQPAPRVDKLRVFFNHPGFVEPMIERAADAFAQLPSERRAAAHLLFTAHSIPTAMANTCRYEAQLREASRLVAEGVGNASHRLVWQSRSGPATQPWLEPDIGDALKEIASADGSRDVIVVPIGFISDHMEVLFDLDYEAKHVADELGLNLIRAGTVGVHPRFVRMVRELVVERMNEGSVRPALGDFGPSHDVCPVDCCKYEPQRPARPTPA